MFTVSHYAMCTVFLFLGVLLSKIRDPIVIHFIVFYDNNVFNIGFIVFYDNNVYNIRFSIAV